MWTARRQARGQTGPEGERAFALTWANVLYDPATGEATERQTFQVSVALDETGDAYTGQTRVSVFDLDGRLLRRSPPGTSRATRLVLQPPD